MLKKVSAALCIATGITQPAHSFQLHPALSLLGNYTTTQNFMTVKEGEFDIDNRKVNLGLELTNKFYLSRSYFIKTGLRYNTYRSIVSGKDQPSPLPGQAHLLTWTRSCEHAAIPLQVGRNFATARGNQGDVFIGMSAGILLTAYAKDDLSSARPQNATGTDLVTAQIRDIADQAPASFLGSVDFGVTYQPFRSAPRFSMGVMCSILSGRTAPYSYQATVNNITRGDQLNYDAQLQQQFVNYAVMFNYSFGKKPVAGRNSGPLVCPE